MSADRRAAGPSPIEYGAAARAAGLIAVAQDLAGEFSLRPLLERILLRCTELLGCDAGSICSVDEAGGTYRKEADIGIRCQSGRVFPISEGMTGAVVNRRAPVWFDRYEDVRGGHVDAADRATLRGVIGVPLEWRGSIIGACIVFSRDDARTFGPADAKLLQLFAKHAAVALTNVRMHDLAEERARATATATERERLLREVYGSLNQGLVGVISQLGRAVDALGGDRDEDVLPLVTAAHLEAREALSQTRRTMLGLMDPGLEDRDRQGGPGRRGRLGATSGPSRRPAGRCGRGDAAGTGAGARDPADRSGGLDQHRPARRCHPGSPGHCVRADWRLALGPRRRPRIRCPQPPRRRRLRGLQRMSDRARAVGGLVELNSVPGWGTSLRARFPNSRPEPEAEGRPLRVLVVDPQPLMRAGVIRLLAQSVVDIDVVGEAEGATRRPSLRVSSVPTWWSRAFVSVVRRTPTASS